MAEIRKNWLVFNGSSWDKYLPYTKADVVGTEDLSINGIDVYDVDEALRTLDDEKLNTSGGNLTGDIIFDNTKGIRGKKSGSNTDLNLIRTNNDNTISLGDSSWSRIYFHNSASPITNNGYQLGEPSLKWRNVYTNYIGDASNRTGFGFFNELDVKQHLFTPYNLLHIGLDQDENECVQVNYGESSDADTRYFGFTLDDADGYNIRYRIKLDDSLYNAHEDEDIYTLIFPEPKGSDKTDTLALISDIKALTFTTWNGTTATGVGSFTATSAGEMRFNQNHLTVSAIGSSQDIYIEANISGIKTAIGKASTTNLGLIKTNYTTSETNYKLNVDENGNGYVSVPWTDTNYYHSTGNWSGLTYTATNNGGNSCPDLSFTIPTGNTSTTVALGNHTHTLSISESGDDEDITLAYGTKYDLTAGGSAIVFKMPDADDTNYYHSTGSWSGLTYTATANGTGCPALAFTIPTGNTATTVAAGNHTHSYLPLSGGTLSGGYGVYANNRKYYSVVNGGLYRDDNSTHTGMLYITLPAIFYGMIKFTVSIYNYSSNTSVDYIISGYTYNDKSWYSVTANCLGKGNLANLAVRFYQADSNNNFHIGIGESTTVWSYPQVTIRDLEVGFSGVGGDWLNGWNIAITTTPPDESTVVFKYSNNNYLPITGGTLVGQLYVNLSSSDKPSYRFNKDGSFYTGIGYHGVTNETYIGATDANGNWANSNVEVFNFGGSIKENHTLLSDKYAAKTHTHNYAGSSSAGGPANSVANKLTLGNNNGVAYEYDGSSAKTVHFLTGLTTTVNAGGTLEVSVSLSASDIPSLDASKITSGTFADARIASASTWNAKMDNPMTASGDIIYGGTSGAPTRLAKGSNGKILKLVSGLPSWEDEYSYTLPQATESALGGVKTYYAKPSSDPTVQSASTTSGRYYGIQVNSDGKMFVNVPWANDNTNYYHSTGSWSGLTYTATNNGGNSCPNLAFTIPTGDTSTTVAVGNHTHSTNISVGGSGTAFSLNYGTKYTLTTGGTEFVFQMPSSDNTDHYSVPLYTTGLDIGEAYGDATEDLYVPIATSSRLGVVKSTTTGTTANRYYNVEVNSDGTMKVNVPWTDTDKWYSPGYNAGLEIGEGKNDLDGTNLYVPYASNTQFGVVKTYYAAPSSAPTVQAVSTTSSRYYGIQVDSNGKMFVNIPWENTTYSAENGISLSSGKFGHSNSQITAQATQGIYPITIDDYGHITAYGSRVSTLPNPEAFTFGTYGTGSQAEDYDGYAAMSLKFDVNAFTTEWTDDVDLTITLNTISTTEIDALFS